MKKRKRGKERGKRKRSEKRRVGRERKRVKERREGGKWTPPIFQTWLRPWQPAIERLKRQQRTQSRRIPNSIWRQQDRTELVRGVYQLTVR